MRIALIEGRRQEAAPSLGGVCPGCNQPVIAKCGTIRVWHWAHRGDAACAFQREPETAWHLKWKSLFSVDEQEIVARDTNGERHIADVKTSTGLVIEFQHSHMPVPERIAREAFYQRMIWVVDGTRLKRDLSRFQKNIGFWLNSDVQDVIVSAFPDECLPGAWLNCPVPVFFDFTGFPSSEHTDSALSSEVWGLLPGRAAERAVLIRMTRREFIRLAHRKDPIILEREFVQLIASQLKREEARERRQWRLRWERAKGWVRSGYRRPHTRF